MKRSARLSSFVLSALLASAAWAMAVPSMAEAAGGPDAWGYTWRYGGELGAAPFDWVDISAVGTPISSLADSASSEAIDLGMDFRWYWSTHSQIYVGANGWAGFNADTHLAPCFPAIPTAGEFENFLAPFLADLTLAGEGNPGRVLTWRDDAGGRFVISWLNVPFHNPARASGFEGNNSFQIILHEDGRIRFQYLNIDAALMSTRTDCSFSSLIGIENITGNIGLDVWSGAFDSTIQAVEFRPPEVTTFLVPDPAPAWIFAPSSRGRIVEVGVPFDIEVNVRNYGNAAVTAHTAQISVTQGLDVRDTFTLDSPALASLASSTLPSRSVTLSEAGAHTVTMTTVSAADINPSNNRKLADLQVVSFDDGPVRLSWVASTTSDSATTDLAGSRAITGFRSPRAPLQVLAIDGVVRITGDFSAANVFVSVLDDDGPFGGPGTELVRANALDSPSFTDDGWARVLLDTPVLIDDGSFYVAFESDSPNVAIGIDDSPPFSLQTWEDVDELGVYRDRFRGDFMLGALVEVVPTDLGGDDAGSSDAGSSDAGDTDAGIDDVGATDTGSDADIEDTVSTDSGTDVTTGDTDLPDADPDVESDGNGPSDASSDAEVAPDIVAPDSSTVDAEPDGQGGGDTSVPDATGTGDTSAANDEDGRLNDSGGTAEPDGDGSTDDDGDSSTGGGCSTSSSHNAGHNAVWYLGLVGLLLPRRKLRR